MVSRVMSLALKLCAVQGAVALFGSLLALAVAGLPAAGAALFGGVAALVPTLVSGWRASVRRADETPQEMLGSFYRAELVKIALSVFLLAAGAVWFASQFLPLILTFSACLFAYWVALAAGW